VTAGLRLALTTFTVLPLRPGRVDRRAAATAMVLAPAVGAALGLVAAGTVRLLPASPLLAAALTVAAVAALTRGLHLDGLADTADGLGTYGDPERALAVMKAPDVGAFGVVTVVLALLVQTAALAGVTLAGAVTALAAGRLAVTWACRRGVPAARPDGLGALVAGTVPVAAALAATAAVVGLAVPAVPDRPWQGPLAVGLALAASLLLTRHTVRRLGGITGDVLGAAVEVTTTAALVVLSLH